MAFPQVPSTHDVLTVARLAAAHAVADEDALAALLRGSGYTQPEADRAVVLVPAAFARPILLKLGVEHLPTNYQVQDEAGTWHVRPLGEEPWFHAGLVVAAAVRTHGYATEGCTGPTPSFAEFEAVLRLSPEMNVTGQALDQGIDLRGSTLQPLQVYRWRVSRSPPPWQFWRK